MSISKANEHHRYPVFEAAIYEGRQTCRFLVRLCLWRLSSKALPTPVRR